MTPETLGPYRLDREIGVGGMGKVYAATLTREAAGLAPGTTVALKVVHPHLLETEGFFRRFLREADIGATVRHENVVRTYLADALSGRHFLVMEYVEGQTLADPQRELDRVPEELCRHVGREICKGLSAIGDRHVTAGTHLALGSLRAARCPMSGSGGAGGLESLAAARDLAAQRQLHLCMDDKRICASDRRHGDRPRRRIRPCPGSAAAAAGL